MIRKPDDKYSSANPHPFDVYVGMRLRQRRIMCGMSQDKLGSKVGITFQQVQKYERGINRIGCSRLFEFSVILGISPGYFFEGFDECIQQQNIDNAREYHPTEEVYFIEKINEKEIRHCYVINYTFAMTLILLRNKGNFAANSGSYLQEISRS